MRGCSRITRCGPYLQLWVIALTCLVASACASAPKAAAPGQLGPALKAAPAPAAAAQAPASQPAAPVAPKVDPTVAPVQTSHANAYRSFAAARTPPTERELKVLASAKKLIGQKPDAAVTVNGKAFTLDCIGTVAASYYGAGIDVEKDFGKYGGNGVNRFYMTLKDKGLIFFDAYPRPGDAIVWDNTWDANGDADRTNDLRTHAGILISVDEDGTIAYLHENLYLGVVVEYMNILRPTEPRDASGKRLNSGMAIATASGGPKPDHWLAGDVWDAFGDVLGLDSRFQVPVAIESVPTEAVAALGLGGRAP
jgi:hypothetical protein